MRKIFTRLISIFVLSTVLVIQGFAADGPTLTPKNGDFTNLKMTEEFVFTASEAVKAGAGVVRLKKLDGTTLDAFQATDSRVAISTDGLEVSVDFTSFYENEGDQFKLDCDANFLVSASDAPLGGTLVWNVVLGDYTAPVLAATNPLNPANGQVGKVNLDADLMVTFSESVEVVAGSQVYVYTDNGTANGDLFDIVEAGEITGSGTTTLTIPVGSDFELKTAYYVVLPDGVVTDASQNENPFTGWLNETTWAFTTRDNIAPVVTATAANISATGFDAMVQLDMPGMVYVMAVKKGDTPSEADFTEANGMVSATVEAANTDVTVSLSKTALGDMAEKTEYDVWAYAENEENPADESEPVMVISGVVTADVTAPVVTKWYPAKGETVIDFDEEEYLELYLSEEVQFGTGKVDIYTWDSEGNHEMLVSVPAANCMLNEAMNVLSIPVDKTLWVSEATYYVVYSEGLVTDPSGNKVAGITDTEDWKFTVEDFLAPTYVVVPADGATGVGKDEAITITFNEDITFSNDDVTGAIFLKQGETGVTYNYDFDGEKVVTITIPDVESSAAYKLTIIDRNIEDAVGNAGSGSTEVNFTIEDFVAPEITIEPLMPGETDNINVIFTEKVYNTDGSDITDSDVSGIVLFRKGTSVEGDFVAATYTVTEEEGKTVFVINPDQDFTTQGEKYFVRVGPGAVVDGSDNLNIEKEEVLEVADFIAPTATITPDGTSNVNHMGLTPVITFSEEMYTLDGTAVSGDASAYINVKEEGSIMPFTASWDTEGKVISVTAVFEADKTYEISIGKSLQDAQGLAFEGASVQFTTWATDAPEMVSVTPVEDATEQDIDVVITVTFDQDITVVDASKVKINGAAATSATASGAVLTIGHNDFVTDQEVDVIVESGAVKASNDVMNASDIAWLFVTKDTKAPLVVLENSTSDGAAVDADLVLAFNEEIVLKTGVFEVKNASNEVTVMTLTEADAKVEGEMLLITPSSTLGYGMTYYVTVTSGVVTDLAGNEYENGITGKGWMFTTAGMPADNIVVVASNPTDNEDKVAAGINPITVEFNRDLKVGSLSSTAKISLSDGTVVFDEVANSTRFSISGKTLSINTGSDIVADKTYTLTIAEGVVTDDYDNVNSAATITFNTTLDTEAGVLTATLDDNSETPGTAIDMTVGFDEVGTVYYAVLASSADAPSASEIMAMNNTIAFEAGGTMVETVTGFVSGEDYIAYLVAVDESGNETDVYITDALTTADVIKPMLVEMTPANGAVDVAIDANLVLTFNEAVNVGTTGSVVLRDPETDVVVAEGTVLSTDDVIATVEITPVLKYLTAYYVEVAAGTFIDEAGNGMEGISGTDAWTFTTKEADEPEDKDDPILEETSPVLAGTPEFKVDETLSLVFNEAIKFEAGTVYVRYSDGDEVFEVISSDALTLSADKTTVTFNLTNVPVKEEVFYVDMTGVEFSDMADNKWANDLGKDWDFIILDKIAPALASSTPEDGSTGVGIDTDITLVFTEAIYKNSNGDEFNGTDPKIEDVVTLMDAAGKEVDAAIVYNKVDYTVTITPAAALESVSTYTVSVDPVYDNRGNVSDEITISFTTKDASPPTVTWMPENNSTFNPKTGVVTVTFNEPVYDEILIINDKEIILDITDQDIETYFDYSLVGGGSVSYTGTISSDKMVMVLTPEASEVPLTSEATYHVMLKADVVVDRAVNNNEMDEIFFQIEDYSVPTTEADAYLPMGDTDNDAVMIITFSENVAVGSGKIVIREQVTGALVEEIAVSASNVTIEDNVATIAHADFPEDMDFFVTAEAGTFTDASANANPWAGIAADAMDVWTFSTDDETDPVVIDGGLYPAPGATNAMTTSELKMTFNEDVLVSGSFKAVIYNADWTPFEVSTDATFMDNVITINHATFMASSTYFVRVMAGSVVDLNGNEYAGLMNNDWTFSTEDDSAPEIVATTPVDDATDVDPYANLSIEFKGSVFAGSEGKIELYKADGTLVESIDPTSASISIVENVATIMLAQLPEDETSYYVIVEPGSFTNTSTERLPLEEGIGIQEWDFTTGIGVEPAPVLVTMTPDKETITDNHPTFVMTFDRNVALGDTPGNLYITEKDATEAHLAIEITADMIADNVVTVTYVYDEAIGGLKTDTEYFVTVDAGAVVNSAGVAWDGIAETTEWTFTTGPDYATGIEIPEVTADFKVYPNPFNDRIFIDNNDKLIRVVVSNIAGQRVIDVNYPEREIRTDNLVSGIYVVSLITEDGIAKTEKIIKK